MRLSRIRIENFRSFKDETITLDDYTCLVGANGAGKSAVLTALNVFFRNNASTATDVLKRTAEDFHHRNTARTVKITLTFDQLSEEAQHDLKHYYRHGELTVLAKAEWDAERENAEIRQYGSRLVMKAFAPFFEAVNTGARVQELKEKYSDILAKYPDLPQPGSKTAMIDVLRDYEEVRPDDCEFLEESNQFFGWSKGENLISKYIQWVYIPAVKDASTEQEENNKTALGQLVERTVRTRVSFDDSIAELRKELGDKYKKIIDSEKEPLADLENSIQERLRRWANPAVDLSLDWYFDPSKSLTVKEPVARFSIGEDGFLGEVPRLGHGLQRSFLLAVLQELATSNQEESPTLLLGFEEPELY